jgi:hypothetical protein
MMVVTMLANYLSTQLPAQMAVNDGNRVLEVENQVARLAASLQAAAGSYAVGRVLTQPVSLGSVEAPPFGAADGGSIGPGAQGSELTESFTVVGQTTYAPPTVGPAGGRSYSQCSTQTTTSLICSTSRPVIWNFSSSSPAAYSVSTSGGPYDINISASGSTIAFTASSSAPDYVLLVGNNDTLTFTISGTSNVIHLVVIGNYDTVTFAAATWTTSTVSVLFVGNHDTLSTGTQTLSSSTLIGSFFGSHDTTTLGTTSLTSSSMRIYYNGFVPSSPSATCPVDNLAASTDSVTDASGSSQSGSPYTVTYNDTSVSSGTAPPSPWTGTFAEPAQFACPYYTTVTIPQKSSGSAGASLVVLLRNTYTPRDEVAFDQGAVVYAQPSGVPLMLVNPSISYQGGTLSLWVPEFQGKVGTEAGVGTAELSVRLVSLLNVNLPASGFSLSGTTSIAVMTPFAAAWTSYLSGTSLASHTVCVPASSTACTGPFAFNGPLGTVYVNVTATALSIQIATFSVALG